jgi:hypothetical protein
LPISLSSHSTDCLPSNSYPGIACDIPSHSYQFSFENNPQWSSYYAPGSEIQDYLKRVTKKYDGYRYMKFQHQVQKAVWDEAEGKWRVDVLNTAKGTVRGCFIARDAVALIDIPVIHRHSRTPPTSSAPQPACSTSGDGLIFPACTVSKANSSIPPHTIPRTITRASEWL